MKMSIIIPAIIGIIMFAFAPKTQTVSKEQCIAYWEQRTETWDNPPDYYRIRRSAEYCGNL